MRFLTILSLLFASCFLTQSFCSSSFAREIGPPNIVLILADDMGYGDPHSLNPTSKIATPGLDRLANEGMTFTDAHTPSSVCTPTRYGLLTGRYCWRSRLKRGVLNGYSPHLINTERATIASTLKSAGYNTGIVGKWHLGLDFVSKSEKPQDFDYSKPVAVGPNSYGFDYSFIIPASLDFPPYVYLKNHHPVELPTVNQPAQKFPTFLRQGPRSPGLKMADVLDDLTAEATGFITKHANQKKPFFLYMPLSAPHKPVWPHPRYIGKTDLGPYGDFVTQVDEIIGNVLKSIDENKVTDNTLVVFTSDNGSFMYRYDDDKTTDHVDDQSIQGFRAEHHRANNMLRGTKADIWEAGHRVPFFVRWPGRVKPKSSSSVTVCLTDLFATCAEISGQKLAKDSAEDSFSLVPILQNSSLIPPRAPVIHHSSGAMFAIRDGDWKLVLGNGSGGRQLPKGKAFGTPYELYNLAVDIEESWNVAEKFPEVVESLTAKFQKIFDGGRSRE